MHGHSNVYGATLFPHNIGLGAARDTDLIKRIGQATAKEVAATGIEWSFAPTVAVVRDDRWGRTYESYSENPDLVKDTTTGAVINTNSNAFARRRAQMALQIEKDNKLEQLEKDVAELKKLIKGMSK